MTFDPADIKFPQLPAGLYWQVTAERYSFEINVEEEVKNPYNPNWFQRLLGDRPEASWRVIASETFNNQDITRENILKAIFRLELAAGLYHTAKTMKEAK